MRKRLEDAPQSNQRGIETSLIVMPSFSTISRLNRTSVGLKRLQIVSGARAVPLASIEPAWD